MKVSLVYPLKYWELLTQVKLSMGRDEAQYLSTWNPQSTHVKTIFLLVNHEVSVHCKFHLEFSTYRKTE